MRATAPATAVRPLVHGPSLTRAALVLATGVLAVGLVLVVAVGAGSQPIPPGDSIGILGHRLLALPLPETWSRVDETILLQIRLPRVLTAMLVGGGLAMAGAVFQALLRNPLADPYIIGTAAGASLGAVTGIVLPILVPSLAVGIGTAWLGIGIVQLLAFVGGISAVLLVFAIARGQGRTSAVTLLLTGYAVSAILAAVVALLMVASGRALGAVFNWLMGSLADAGWAELALAAPLVGISFLLVFARWRQLNLLLLGEGHASTLGVDVGRERLRLTMLATLATSAVVAISGTIGFVGLVVPHLLRLAIGPDHRLLLPASMLFGAALLALADLVARLLGGLPVGIVTALIGAPFFLYLLRRSRTVVPEPAT